MNNEEVEFTIKCKMKKRWVNHFMSMLRYMEYLGNVGSSRRVSLYADGDGVFRPKFETKIEHKKEEPIHDDYGHCLYDAG